METRQSGRAALPIECWPVLMGRLVGEGLVLRACLARVSPIGFAAAEIVLANIAANMIALNHWPPGPGARPLVMSSTSFSRAGIAR
jgi:hypothetical protein